MSATVATTATATGKQAAARCRQHATGASTHQQQRLSHVNAALQQLLNAAASLSMPMRLSCQRHCNSSNNVNILDNSSSRGRGMVKGGGGAHSFKSAAFASAIINNMYAASATAAASPAAASAAAIADVALVLNWHCLRLCRCCCLQHVAAAAVVAVILQRTFNLFMAARGWLPTSLELFPLATQSNKVPLPSSPSSLPSPFAPLPVCALPKWQLSKQFIAKMLSLINVWIARRN